MLRTSRVVFREKHFHIMELGRDRAREMTDFVYETYFSRFQGRYGILDRDDYVRMAIDDLFTLNGSAIYAAVADRGPCLGSIRIIERKGPLPAEKEFDFDALAAVRRHFPEARRIQRMYEIGRFATSIENIRLCELPKSHSVFITDCLLRAMFLHVTREPDSFGVASLDVTTLRILKMRGLSVTPIGAPREYLGSPTVPVVLSADRCLENLRRHRPHQYAFMTATEIETPARVSA